MKKISVIICFVVLLTAIFIGCSSNSQTPAGGYIPTWLQGTWDYCPSGQPALTTENGLVATSSAIYYDDVVLGKVHIYDGTNSYFTDILTLSNPSSTCFKIAMNIAGNTYYQFDYVDENTVKMTERNEADGTRADYDLTKGGSSSES